MNISKSNCEAFFLDYYEGNLSEAQIAEMFAFLKANPDQREVFESFADVSVDTDNLHSPDFSFLKKATEVDVHETAEQWMVAAAEGTISAEDRISLDKYLIDNPAKRADLLAFEKTILRADENESFGDLSALKKRIAITAENFEYYAIASMEGTISPDEKQLLDAYVSAHPEFQQQMNDLHATRLQPEEAVTFEWKLALKKTELSVGHDNIEELLLSKSEGLLSASEEQAVDKFIAQHPQYQAELTLLSKAKLTPDNAEVFGEKNQLKKGALLITGENIEELVIAANEGLLNGEEVKALNAFVATHPQYRNLQAQYAATQLQPDLQIVYEDKAGLKRKEKGGAIWWSVNIRYAAAAIVVLIFGIYFWMKYNTGSPEVQPFANKNENGIQHNNGVVAPTDGNNVLPQNDGSNQQYASNDGAQNGTTQDVNTSRGVHSNGRNTNVAVVTPAQIVRETFNPVTIMAGSIPNKRNDAVAFSDALYGTMFENNPNVRVTPADEYISPGQYAMRWVNDKLKGNDGGADAWENQNIQGFGSGQNRDKNVDGIDLTETAVNRVGQSAAGGNISMDQRKDGTYLHVWNYEVRVSK